MDNNAWKRILKFLILGIGVAVGGMLFSSFIGSLFNGMAYGDAANLGIGMYLCIVVVTCTGVIISYLDKK